MKTSLNFNWKFIPSFKEEYLKALPKDAREVDIPHNAFIVPYNYFSEESYQEIVTYEKTFDIKKKENKRYFIKFEGFMVKAKVYLNDELLGEYISAYIPVEIEVTEQIKDHNRLVVVLDTHEDENIPPFGFALDYITFSGIYREVYLYEEPLTYLRHIYVNADKEGNIDILYDKIGEKEVNLTYKVFDGDALIKESKESSFKIDNPKLWDLDNPYLYKLIIELELDNEVTTYETRFGFRNVEFTNHGFYLNGKQIKLIGLNRHQGYPYMGYAASKSLQEDDANLLKYEVGVNAVRTSHYPQSEHFLSRCDEIGLLVLNEIPGWQHIGTSEAWRNQCLVNTKEMVLKERNHPCLIAHGVRIDESIDDHELYTKTNAIAHEFDKYRQTIGVRNFTNSEQLEDVYGFNDFSCDSLKIGLKNPKKVKKNDKPLLVTEYMGHMDPLKATSDEQKRVEVSLRHAKVIDDNLKYKNTVGAIGWCFVDYQSHTDFGSGDHICPHGVFDLYRNPKYSSYIYASQQDKFPVLSVLSNMKPGDVPEAIFNDIYVASNCDYVELYKNDEFVNRFYPNHKTFKFLKHPPILIDDIVGYTFNEDKFPKESHLKIANMFSYAAMHGFNKLPLRTTLYLGYMMMRYKVNYSLLVHYWNKYVGAWGGKAKTYTFKGFKDDKMVKQVEIGPSNEFHYEFTLSKDELVNEDTYDTIRIRVKHLDNHGSLLQYSSRILNISTEGPIELIGPSSQALLGGQLSIYIRSAKEKGVGQIHISTDESTHTITIPVK